jgi:hypothetical protein
MWFPNSSLWHFLCIQDTLQIVLVFFENSACLEETSTSSQWPVLITAPRYKCYIQLMLKHTPECIYQFNMFIEQCQVLFETFGISWQLW